MAERGGNDLGIETDRRGRTGRQREQHWRAGPERGVDGGDDDVEAVRVELPEHFRKSRAASRG